MTGTAEIDPTGRYRYHLLRAWDSELFQGELKRKGVCWIMLNPSTADAEDDDATIRKITTYTKAWGYGHLVVVNLFAWRATDPRALKASEDPVGPENDRWISSAARSAGLVVCGWGNHGDLRGREAQVLRLLRAAATEPLALRITKRGAPEHPLYLPGDLRPQELAL